MARFDEISPYRRREPYWDRQREMMEYEYFNRSYSREIQRRPGTVIVCPVCASDRCEWWEQQILRNNAGDILKDMLHGIFKGEQYYDRGGGYREQEEYY